ncbi:MAG: DUF364 domain-containing protein [candidate division KSB1 bacterium]|nr:DUF364 domain-containing protein [candidate division KSB1 bacterium]
MPQELSRKAFKRNLNTYSHKHKRLPPELQQPLVVAICGTTWLNHTFDKVINLCKKDAFKLMLGASTPMTPILFDYGIDVISGSKVMRPDVALECISQGATFKQIDGIKQLSMKR